MCPCPTSSIHSLSFWSRISCRTLLVLHLEAFQSLPDPPIHSSQYIYSSRHFALLRLAYNMARILRKREKALSLDPQAESARRSKHTENPGKDITNSESVKKEVFKQATRSGESMIPETPKKSINISTACSDSTKPEEKVPEEKEATKATQKMSSEAEQTLRNGSGNQDNAPKKGKKPSEHAILKTKKRARGDKYTLNPQETAEVCEMYSVLRRRLTCHSGQLQAAFPSYDERTVENRHITLKDPIV